MTRIKTLMSQLLVVVNLAIGRMPLMITLLDLQARPTAARVAITRRRQLEYAELFTAADRDGRRAAPFHRAESTSAKRRYRWVDTA